MTNKRAIISCINCKSLPGNQTDVKARCKLDSHQTTFELTSYFKAHKPIQKFLVLANLVTWWQKSSIWDLSLNCHQAISLAVSPLATSRIIYFSYSHKKFIREKKKDVWFKQENSSSLRFQKIEEGEKQFHFSISFYLLNFTAVFPLC